MTKQPPILQSSALVVPFAVALGLLWGRDTAVATLLSSIVALSNLWVLSILGPRMVTAAARDEQGMALICGAGITAKFLLVCALYVWMAKTLPPIGVAFGFVPMLGGTLITALILARADDAQANPAGGT
jgi:hypothetical protein